MTYLFGTFAVDPLRREVRSEGEVVHVEPQVFDLLIYFLDNRDRVVTKDELFNAVWQGRIVSEATLSSRINAARRAIGDSGDKQNYIRTVQRRGFLFSGDKVSRSLATTTETTAAHEGIAKKQKVRFCKTGGGLHLAVATVGDGPPLVKTANWLTHLDFDWKSPLNRPLFEHLATRRCLVRYDARGTGLSDRNVQDISFSAFLGDLQSVVDSLGLAKFSLLGISQGAAVAAAYAARHPERVHKLMLHGGYAQGRRQRGSPADEEQAQAFTTLLRYGWGHEQSAFMHAFSSIYVPGGTQEQIRAFTELQRVSATGDVAARIRQACDQIDVVADLPAIRAPTLISHSRYDHVAPFEQGRMLAQLIPDATLVPLESENHILLPNESAWSQWTSEMDAFLSE